MSTATKRSITIDIHKKWCKQCGICIAFCPEKVYEEQEGYPVIVALDKCTGCMQCEMLCPDFAIAVHVEKAPAKEASHE